MDKKEKSVARCTQHFCLCTQQLRGKDICTSGLINLKKKLFILLSPFQSRIPASASSSPFLLLLSFWSPPSRVLLLPNLCSSSSSRKSLSTVVITAAHSFFIFVFFVIIDRAAVGIPAKLTVVLLPPRVGIVEVRILRVEFVGIACNRESSGSS